MESKREKSIFKGNYETQLIMGKALYNKIQFREVTSYFKNGWVHFVVCAKPLPFSYSNTQGTYERCIDWHDVCPLVISQMVVKAKKKL